MRMATEKGILIEENTQHDLVCQAWVFGNTKAKFNSPNNQMF